MDEEPADTEDWPYKCMFCFYSNRLNFLEKFYIQSKIEKKATDFSHTPFAPPPPCITPIINILHQSDTLLQPRSCIDISWSLRIRSLC